MDYTLIKEFLSSYSLSSIIISLIVAICCFIIRKTIKKEVSSLLFNQLPFMLGVVIYFAYDMIFVSKGFVFREDAFIAGLICGSLAVIFTAFVSKIRRGEHASLSSPTSLLIEGLLDGVVEQNNLVSTAIKVEQIIIDGKNEEDCDKILLKTQIVEMLKENSASELTDGEFFRLTELILQAVDGE